MSGTPPVGVEPHPARAILPSRDTAVITGASSGIGAAFAVALARRGTGLLLTGRRSEPLEAVAEQCRALGVPVQTMLVELSDPIARRRFLETVRRIDSVSLVVANAGFGYPKPFVNGPIEPVVRMIEVHVTAVVELFHVVLPAMVERGSGGLIAVSSLASRLPVPGAESYVASKSYLNSFCESLSVAVRDSGVTVQTLLPGFTRTDFHRYDAQFVDTQPRFLRWMSPGAVVDASLRCLDRRRPVCIPGWSNRLMATCLGALPRGVLRSLMRSLARSKEAPRPDGADRPKRQSGTGETR